MLPQLFIQIAHGAGAVNQGGNGGANGSEESHILRIWDSGRKYPVAELTLYPPAVSGHSRDWAGCTIVMIGLPDLISMSSRGS